jgi:hypothetical protein
MACTREVIQNNSRFALIDSLEVHMDHFRMPAGNGNSRIKTKGRPLNVSSTFKRVLSLWMQLFCVRHTHLWLLSPGKMFTQSTHHIEMVGVWRNLLKAFECFRCWFIDWRSFKKFNIFISKFRATKLLFDGLYSDRVMVSGNSLSAKKLYLLCDRNNVHYNEITNLKGAMAKGYICNGCDTLNNFTHKCAKVCHLVLKSVQVLWYM